MPIVETTPQRLVLKSGSTTLTLDKATGKAILQRKLLLWGLKPVEAPLSEITDITIDTAVDRASGVEILSHDAHHAWERGLGLSSRRQDGRGDECGRDAPFPCHRNLEHDPEKACPGLDPGWVPVFRKDHAQTKS